MSHRIVCRWVAKFETCYMYETLNNNNIVKNAPNLIETQKIYREAEKLVVRTCL